MSKKFDDKTHIVGLGVLDELLKVLDGAVGVRVLEDHTSNILWQEKMYKVNTTIAEHKKNYKKKKRKRK